MIGLDTNVLVRYVVRDDPAQAAAADRLIDSCTAENPGYLSLLVVVESWWVLGSAYSYSSEERREFIEALLEAKELVVESPDLVRGAVRHVADGADFADALIALSGRARGCAEVMTLDKKAAGRAGMTLLAS